MKRALYCFSLVCLLIVASRAPVHAHDPNEESDPLPEILRSARFDQRLGEALALDLTFRDEQGQTVHLSDYFGEKPVILTMNYYECDTLCPLILDGVARALKLVPFTIGQEFELVTVSIDPRETPELAASVKERLVELYEREGAGWNWHLLTGEQATITQLAESVGFNYVWDERTQQYAHPSGVVVLSPDGTIARYIYGMEFSPRDLRLALVEASENKIASPVDHVLLFCYRYDPMTGKYGPIAMNTMRLGGIATLLTLGFSIGVMIRRDRRRTEDGRRRTEDGGR
ncbi:MAG: SCO family protein [Ardenticatenaceae bacterium]